MSTRPGDEIKVHETWWPRPVHELLSAIIFLSRRSDLGRNGAMTNASLLDLPWLLSPITTSDFQEGYLEKQALFISAGDSLKYDQLMKSTDLELWFWQQEHRLSALVTAFSCGTQLHPERYLSKELYRRWLLEVYQRGGTLVVNQVDEFCLPVAQLVRELSTVFMGEVSANLYVSPPSAVGFAPHFDRHDVFVIQVAGSKNWRVMDVPETELPTERQLQGVSPRMDAQAREIRMTRGCLLYQPRPGARSER